jgi:hypothetical protein
MRILLVSLLLTTMWASAQTAKYITLQPQDAENMKAIDKAIADKQEERSKYLVIIKNRYTVLDKCPLGHNCTYADSIITLGGTSIDYRRYYVPGWENGFEFSEDYKLIVPVPQGVVKSGPSSNICPYGYGIFTGAAIASPVTGMGIVHGEYTDFENREVEPFYDMSGVQVTTGLYGDNTPSIAHKDIKLLRRPQ